MSGHPEIVIVRRRSSHEGGHHGGALKIAFADFMTAMMAFFLVLWIISATDKNTKTLIARYFNPVKLEEPAKAQNGIHGAPEQDTDAPGRDSGAPNGEKSRSAQGDAASGNVPEAPEAKPGDPKQKHKGKLDPKAPPPVPARPNPTMSEAELFSDPRASLDKIAGAPPARAASRSRGRAEGLRRGRPQRRRGLPRSLPAARQRQGHERGRGRSRRAGRPRSGQPGREPPGARARAGDRRARRRVPGGPRQARAERHAVERRRRSGEERIVRRRRRKAAGGGGETAFRGSEADYDGRRGSARGCAARRGEEAS